MTDKERFAYVLLAGFISWHSTQVTMQNNGDKSSEFMNVFDTVAAVKIETDNILT